MKFLDDIAALRAQTEALIEASASAQRATSEMQEQARRLEDTLAQVRDAIANAPGPRTFEIKTSAGQEFVVSERDALLIICAAMVNLDSKEARVTLDSGQTIALKLTDLEQTAAVIIAASQRVAS